ncbi:hypothetical protein SELMODRAFT_419994 [Selaginella moellendorffii]|uniref:Uncharacterized protein n=1 Tax=Selaginella moellendorffii TaxID=88036 RepID=D8SA79_SELML|nr:hypothetical protein SELMODRAFT_419994 [Selaginella moellendorffii]
MRFAALINQKCHVKNKDLDGIYVSKKGLHAMRFTALINQVRCSHQPELDAPVLASFLEVNSDENLGGVAHATHDLRIQHCHHQIHWVRARSHAAILHDLLQFLFGCVVDTN